MTFYTTEKVAEILDVSVESVQRWIRNKRLKASKVGRGYRIKKEDLEKFIDENMNV
jgi:excisionase family DNA binding protein